MSKKWMSEKKKEYYYRKAKAENYRSRASYKLLQLSKKFKVLKQGDRVLDLGASPGGWMQVARKIVGEEGYVLGIDLENIASFEFENVSSLKTDLFLDETVTEIKGILGTADVVLSDASPDISGVWSIDHLKSVDLCNRALDIAGEVLRPGGNMLLKIFQGEETKGFYDLVKGRFGYSKMTKPKASRGRSSEMYIVAKGFKA